MIEIDIVFGQSSFPGVKLNLVPSDSVIILKEKRYATDETIFFA